MGVSGIVLAGGRSSRMGRDKTLLVVENETLIERTVKELRRITDEIIIASNATAKYGLPGVREVPDVFPGMGPLGGLHAGLLAAQNDVVFAVAADMPCFTDKLAAYLLGRKGDHDAVVPRPGQEWEPLCAVYSRACAGPIEQCLRAGMKKVYSFYPAVKVLAVTGEELGAAGLPATMFFNLNAPEDLDLLRRGNGPEGGPEVSG
ncbi:molybdenum cofactor guanylyltransferase [Anaeroselena agilis]|uniref:Probable molybdenum cofactor guanylyltransferase n=1 Tax=Anaeroselena agilis TaxID=3063788 RepID=A0ABU3NTS7_9FIRM|nr:molybdenum cofactor guanylyltransferase [Selenomonadales bacterium 4137-cl]